MRRARQRRDASTRGASIVRCPSREALRRLAAIGVESVEIAPVMNGIQATATLPNGDRRSVWAIAAVPAIVALSLQLCGKV